MSLGDIASAGVNEMISVADNTTKQAGVAIGALIDGAETTAQLGEATLATVATDTVAAARQLLANAETAREAYVAALRKAMGAATDLVP